MSIKKPLSPEPSAPSTNRPFGAVPTWTVFAASVVVMFILAAAGQAGPGLAVLLAVTAVWLLRRSALRRPTASPIGGKPSTRSGIAAGILGLLAVVFALTPTPPATQSTSTASQSQLADTSLTTAEPSSESSTPEASATTATTAPATMSPASTPSPTEAAPTTPPPAPVQTAAAQPKSGPAASPAAPVAAPPKPAAPAPTAPAPYAAPPAPQAPAPAAPAPAAPAAAAPVPPAPFPNCQAARAAGYSNIPSTSPYYNPKSDGDHDGIACEG